MNIKNIIGTDIKDFVILEGEISVLSVMSSAPQRILKVILKDGVKYKNAEKVLNMAKSKNVKIEFAHVEVIENLAYGKTHGGVIAIAAKRIYPAVGEMLASLDKTKANHSISVLEGIEDPYNLGCAARAMYAMGTDALIIQERDLDFSETVIEKASTGAFSMMTTAAFGKSEEDKTEVIKLLKDEGFTVYCIDEKKDAESVFDVRFAAKTAFIIGGEKRGISKSFIEGADKFVRIPYDRADFAYSLTAQTAATIVSYEIYRQSCVY